MPSKLSQIELNGVTYDIKDAEALKILNEGEQDEIVVLSNSQREVIASGTTLAELFSRIDVATIVDNVEDGEWIVNIINSDGSIDMSNYYSKSKVDELIAEALRTALNPANIQFSQAQLDALASGVTTAKITAYDGHVANSDIHLSQGERETLATKAWIASQGYTTIEDVQPAIDAIVAHNIADGVTIKSGKAIRYTDGAVYNSESLAYSDYVNVENLSAIIYPQILSTSTASNIVFGMAFYDSNRDYISGDKAQWNKPVFGTELKKISVPQNAVYARFTWHTILPELVVYDASEYEATLPVRVDSAEDEIDTLRTLISEIPKFDIEVVERLPEEVISESTIYLVTNSGSGNQMYDEYIYVNDGWEKLGTQELDLTGYATEEYVDDAISDVNIDADINSICSLFVDYAGIGNGDYIGIDEDTAIAF